MVSETVVFKRYLNRFADFYLVLPARATVSNTRWKRFPETAAVQGAADAP